MEIANNGGIGWDRRSFVEDPQFHNLLAHRFFGQLSWPVPRALMTVESARAVSAAEHQAARMTTATIFIGL